MASNTLSRNGLVVVADDDAAAHLDGAAEPVQAPHNRLPAIPPRSEVGPALAVGKRFAIKQPGMAKLVWQVTEIDPGSSWTWVQRSPGSTVTARHYVDAQPGGRTLVRQQLDQRGPLGALVGHLMVKKTKRFLQLEAQGLKARSEQLSRADGSHA